MKHLDSFVNLTEVKKKDLDALFHYLVPKIYRFSYVLLPDNLQAQQVVLDVLGLLSVEEEKLLSPLLNEHDFSKKEDLTVVAFSYIYKLAFKRLQQLPLTAPYFFDPFNDKKEGSDKQFFKLDICERAILFLSKEFSQKEKIAYILDLKNEQYYNCLHKAQVKFGHLLGLSF